jgi:hypothetical protein
MFESENKFLRRITNAIDLQDSASLEAAVSSFSEFTFKEPLAGGQFLSDDFFEHLLEQVVRPDLVGFSDAFKLLSLFETDWGRLNASQRRDVCKTMERVFESLDDPAAMLIATEILGEYQADDSALAALDRMNRSDRDIARAYVAQGYKSLARYAQDPQLHEVARSRLEAMRSDRSGLVQREAAAAIKALSREKS